MFADVCPCPFRSLMAVETYGDSAAVATGLSVTYLLLTAMKDHLHLCARNLAYQGAYIFFLCWTMMATMMWLEVRRIHLHFKMRALCLDGAVTAR